MIPYRIGLGYISPMFFPNMEYRVEQAAKNGWMIFKIDTFFALYRKKEPTDIRCNLVLFEPGLFRGISKEKRKEFRIMCEDSGWSFVSKTRIGQLYITKDLSVTDIRTDFQLAWKEIQRSMKRNWLLIGFALIYLVFIVARISSSITIMNILTSNAILGLLVLVVLQIGYSLIDWLVYRYWLKHNKALFEEDNHRSFRFDFSNRFSLVYGVFTIGYFVMVYLNTIMIMLSFSYHVSRFSGVFIGLIVGNLLRRKMDYSDKDEESNIFLVFVTIILVIVGVSIISPLLVRYQERKPDASKVVLLSDLLIHEEPDFFRAIPMKSIFTTHQVDYIEYAEYSHVSTKGYTFRSEYLLSCYLKEYLKDKEIIPFPNTTDLQGGYLDTSKKKIYMMDDTSIYQISASVELDEKQLTVISRKLLRDD